MYQEIDCPSCGGKIELDPIDNQDLVTYWGDDGPVGVFCECGEEIFVREHVSRTYSVEHDKGLSR